MVLVLTKVSFLSNWNNKIKYYLTGFIFMLSKPVFLDTPFAVKFNIVWANNANFSRFPAHFPSNFLVGRRWLHIMLYSGRKICISGFSGNTFLTSLRQLRTNTDMVLLWYDRLYYSLLVLILHLRFPDIVAVALTTIMFSW